MAANKKYFFLTCYRCGKSMKRFHPSNAFQALGRTGTRYKCPNCQLLYDSQGLVPVLYKIFMSMLMVAFFVLFGIVEGDNKFELGHLMLFLGFPFFYLYIYGVFRPLNPILYKFINRRDFKEKIHGK